MGKSHVVDRLLTKMEHVYQPLWDIVNHRILGYEALLRFFDGSFAEEIETVFRLARTEQSLFELDTASIQAAISHYPLVEWEQESYLFVNVFPSTMTNSKFPSFIKELQMKFPQIIGRLVVEINETIAEADYWAHFRFMEAVDCLKHHGFIIALDDIGESDADFQKIRALAPDFVKLDRSFADGLSGSLKKQKDISKFVHYSHTTPGVEIILEGIEKEVDLQQAVDLQISIGQGYLLGKPKRLTNTNRVGHA